MRRKIRLLGTSIAAVTVLAASVVSAGLSVGADQNSAIANDAAPATADWTMWQKDLAGSRFNASEWKINPATVSGLKLKWAYTFTRVPFARVGAQPAVAGGVLYVGTPDGKFLALGAKTGETRWTFDLTTVTGPTQTPNHVRDGASVVGDKVYFGDSTGRVYALNKDTGKLLWAQRISEHPTALMTGSPLVFDGKVYIGESTGEGGAAKNPNYPCCTHRGQVVALDANTGAVSWRYYPVPPAVQVGTWPSGAAKYAPSGGSVWASPVVDPRSRTLYIGTGNNATGAAGDIDSLLAIDATTGAVRWKHQLTFPDTYTAACELPNPGEYCPGNGSTAHDYDVGATANVIDVAGRTLVTVGHKSGTFHAFDARTGAVVWETKLAEGHEGAGVEWGSVYDGKRIYTATWRSNPGRLYALDPATGRILWQTPHPADGCTTGGAAAHPDLCELTFTPAASGTPGLVYEGSSDGKMRIFAADTGKLLWQFDAIRDFAGVNGITGRGSAISGNGGAVVVDGMLYVQAGYYPFYPNDKGTVLLAFGL